MKPGRWLAVILGLYMALGVAYSLIMPLGEAPDEVDHFLYVRYLVAQQTFPVMQPVAEENATMEANQPPLFYLLNAVITAPLPHTASPDLPLNACYNFTPGSGRAHFYLHDRLEQNALSPAYLAFRAARLLSVVMGAVTVALAYALARQMAPARPSVWLLAAGLLAFNPQFLFITTSVNNDVLMALLGAAIVVTAVAAATQGGYGRFALLGILVGLGLLTKFALLAFWPLAFLAVIGHRLSVIGRQSLPLHNSQFIIHNFLLVTLLPLLIAGWWYGRAHTLYGDPLAWDVHLQAKGAEVLRATPFTIADLWEFARIHFQSYWGWFGWLKLPLPGWVYAVIGIVVIVGIVGVVLEIRELVLNLLKDWRFEFKHDLQSLISNLQSHHIALLFNLYAVIAIYLSLLRYILTINWSGYQGRLAFAAAASIAALLAVGIERGWAQMARQIFADKGEKSASNPKNPRPSASYFLIPTFFILALVALLFIIHPAYARPQLFWPGVDERRVCVDTAVGGQIEAADWQERVQPGHTLPVTLFGLGTGEEHSLTLDLVGFGGKVVAEMETAVPAAPAQPITHTAHLTIAPDARPARALLRLDGQELGWVKIAAARPYTPPPTMHPIQATFANQLTLVGFQSDGDQITLFWQAATPLTADYTTFMHLLDEQGQVIAQADGQPQQGWYPTSVWDVGEVVADDKVLTRPLAPGPYRAVVGVYLLATGERLRLNNGDDVVELFTFTVEE